MAQYDPVGVINAGLVRFLYVLLVTLCVVWNVKYMGGYSMSPDKTGEGANDTLSLFNWHPLTLILAYAVFKSEAAMTYMAYPLDRLTR